MIRQPLTKEKALQRLESLCSRSEQCEFDLNRKMITWGITSQDRKEIIEDLKSNRYVDEARFARSFAHDKSKFSGWGPSKIRMELIKRKISSTVITESLQSVENKVWKDAILRLAENKAKNLDLTGEDSWNNQQKLYRYLIGRGYPSSAVSKIVTMMRKRQEEQA